MFYSILNIKSSKFLDYSSVIYNWVITKSKMLMLPLKSRGLDTLLQHFNDDSFAEREA